MTPCSPKVGRRCWGRTCRPLPTTYVFTGPCRGRQYSPPKHHKLVQHYTASHARECANCLATVCCSDSTNCRQTQLTTAMFCISPQRVRAPFDMYVTSESILAVCLHLRVCDMTIVPFIATAVSSRPAVSNCILGRLCRCVFN